MLFINKAFKDEILNVCKDVVFDEPMKKHTSFKIGGCSDVFARVHSQDEVINIINACKSYNIPFFIIGNGSNLLVGDGGIRGVVIQTSGMKHCTTEGIRIKAECGITLAALAAKAQAASLTGIEFASGIPGTLGGGIYMNAGAYGGEMSDVIESVDFIDNNGISGTLKKGDFDFGYRKSIFSANSYIIMSAVLSLEYGDGTEIKNKMNELNARRTAKQPLDMPSAGSIFKRPEGFFAGKLIEECGLSGYCTGGAKVSEKHSGFIVNYNNATAKDVLNLIAHIQAEVKEKFDVILEPEVKMLGDFQPVIRRMDIQWRTL